jgi:CRISPR-associated endonuclease Csn1
MGKILGLDLGTNSIGWALREINSELENQIIDKGVLTFDKGVAEDKSGEHPMVQKRTEARGKRRNYQAEKYRKWALLECLINEGMCPLTMEELDNWRHYTKGFGRKYPQNEKFIQWLRFDFDGDGKPDFERLGYSKHESYYLFRKLIVDQSKVELFKKEPQIIGRVLYQLVQRRGYNDGQNIDEKEKDELSKTIMKGGGASGATGVNDILPFLEKYKTLGAALYQIQKDNNLRIRKRYNLRSHYEKEIKEICNIQGLEHLYKEFWGAIIWQRPLRSQKGLVGVCTFEKNKRRCPISHPLYEEYRTWVFINNLKIKPIIQNDILKNTIELKEALHKIVYPQFFKSADNFALSSISKELKKVGFEITARFPTDAKVISFSFLNKIKEIFGNDWEDTVDWNNVLNGNDKTNEYNIEDLWHVHFTKTTNKKTGEEPFEFLRRFAKEKLKLNDDKKVETFAKIRLQQGYATLSVNAIRKILPFLKQGFIYTEAVYLANLPKVLGLKRLSLNEIEDYSKFIRKAIIEYRFEQRKVEIINSLIAIYFEDSKAFEINKNELIKNAVIENYGEFNWNSIPIQKAVNILNNITDEINLFLFKPKRKPENHFIKTGRLHDKIFIALMNEKGVSKNNIKYLWHPSEQETYLPAIEKDGKYYLGSPEPISKGFKNPMALKTMHKLKKLINYLIQVGKIDRDTRIVIEIARELNDANKRKAIERWQREREKENDIYKKEIIEINKECNTSFNENDKNLIDKIRLWNEQKKQCLYTGKTISLCEILDGSKYDFEHSIPASMSFDNELKNLTIADKTFNQRVKGKKLPSECPNYENEYFFNGIAYPPILNTMQIMFGKLKEVEIKVKQKTLKVRTFARIEDLENHLEEWKLKKSDDKDINDNIIQRRYLIKMELDYWRKKLQTFTATEFKAGWRNSQLKDTQTITKYALPYLKTVFDKVEVQKGNITSDFRKIYKIQTKFDKKDRTKHSHHAIDAAVLTLIPPAAIRDKILHNYNASKENNIDYHDKPTQWNSFETKYILNIENEVLINYLAEHKTLTPTYKTVRKRGKVEFVIDSVGRKIKKISQGDCIRGQLHADSFYSASKQPQYEFKRNKFIPLSDGKGNFLFQKNEKRNDEIFITKKILITELKTYDDLEIIIDPNLKYFLQKKLAKTDFSKAILEPIWAFDKKEDKNGINIHPIRHLRCKVKGGGGGFVSNPAKIRTRKDFLSTKQYKNFYYAQNGETIVCALYQAIIEGKVFRELNTYSILDISANQNAKKIEETLPLSIDRVIKKERMLIPLFSALQIGQKVLFYQNEMEELKILDKNSIANRMYLIVKFEDGKICFKHNLNSMKDEDLTKEMKKLNLPTTGSSSFNFNAPIPKLRFSQGALNMAIEHKHFQIKLDGTIEWKF